LRHPSRGGFGSQFHGSFICRFEVHPFIVRNSRKAAKGSIRVGKNAPSDFPNAVRRSVTSALAGLDVLAGAQKFPSLQNQYHCSFKTTAVLKIFRQNRMDAAI